MSLLKDLLKEVAAGGSTSAGSIAGFRAPVGAMPKKKSKKKKNREKKVRSRLAPVGSFMTLKMVREATSNFDPAAVLAKMSAAEEKAKYGEETKSFALEDENGDVVKVTVAKDQADDFEDALARALHGDDTDGIFGDSEDDEAQSSKEIAEILFDLKDRFTIVDVEWPQIEEDQEEDATQANAETMDDMEGGEAGAEGEGGEGEDMGDAEGEDLEGEGDAEGMDAEGGEEYDEMSALSQVIDLLKAQQDAQRAEAEAEIAKAEAEKAKAERDEAMAKVRQEEEILDMETYYKDKKDNDKEAKQLAKLAKWKHDMAADDDDIDVKKADIDIGKAAVEQEEKVKRDGVTSGRDIDIYRTKVDADDDGKLDPDDFIRYLFKYLRDR
jgi:hypothetical protein